MTNAFLKEQLKVRFLAVTAQRYTCGASPVLPLASSQTETTPIFDGHTLWHPLERAILLSGYQFLIVS